MSGFTSRFMAGTVIDQLVAGTDEFWNMIVEKDIMFLGNRYEDLKNRILDLLFNQAPTSTAFVIEAPMVIRSVLRGA